MNLANKLTMLRVILIPFFIFFLLTDMAGDNGKWIALAIFVIASLTDFLDGQIARKMNMITNFGKFMDPLADKLLVCSAMIWSNLRSVPHPSVMLSPRKLIFLPFSSILLFPPVGLRACRA